jgi:hypothetical protein
MHIFSYVHSGADYIDRLEAMSIAIFGSSQAGSGAKESGAARSSDR